LTSGDPGAIATDHDDPFDQAGEHDGQQIALLVSSPTRALTSPVIRFIARGKQTELAGRLDRRRGLVVAARELLGGRVIACSGRVSARVKIHDSKPAADQAERAADQQAVAHAGAECPEHVAERDGEPDHPVEIRRDRATR